MMAKRHQGLRSEKLGLHVDEPTKALTERAAPLERRTVSTSNPHEAAWPLRLRQVLQTEIRGPGTMSTSEKRPRARYVSLLAASPLLPRLSSSGWGSKK